MRRRPSRGSRALRRWRLRQGLTLAEVARRLRVAEVVLWRWTVGERVPELEYAVRLERLTGIPAREWVAGQSDGRRAA